MKLSRIKPFNWFKREQPSAGELLPRRAEGTDPLARMHREMDRMFEDFFGGRWPDWPVQSSDLVLRPNVDIAESKKTYRISVEVPGVEENELELSVDGDTLIISGQKRQEHEEDEEGFHRVERRYGSFRRVLSLPDDADVDGIKANFRNGVLEIKVPRRESSQGAARSINIG